MNRHERLSGLLSVLGTRGKVVVEALAEELAVSAATIRRDLDHLAERRLLIRTRGGAIAAHDPPPRHESTPRAPEQSRIGRNVALLVEPGAVIGLNGGATTTEIARAIAARAELDHRPGRPALTVVTNALNIAAELAGRRHLRLVVTGGVARPRSFALTGPLATRVLTDISLDLLILGVDGIDPDGGAYAHHEGEADINRLMVARAARVVVAADGSKLGRRAVARICPIGAVDLVVTDAPVAAEVGRRFAGAGVRLRAV